MRTAAVLLLAAAAAGCQPDPAPIVDPAPADPSPFPIDHAGWPPLTAEPVRVHAQFLAMCRAPTEEEERRASPFHFAPNLQFYANPAAAEAIRSGAAPVPFGATVVKEKRWQDDGPVTAYAAMVKREPGYDPGNGDWEYVYTFQKDEGTWDTQRGKLASCIECHRNASATDYLFRTYLTK
jgi:hypothetical protein